jgi:hypothetical protein
MKGEMYELMTWRVPGESPHGSSGRRYTSAQLGLTVTGSKVRAVTHRSTPVISRDP